MSSTYHPQIDSQIEVGIVFLEAYVYCFVIDKKKIWFHGYVSLNGGINILTTDNTN
jgi:hypothetical protein